MCGSRLQAKYKLQISKEGGKFAFLAALVSTMYMGRKYSDTLFTYSELLVSS